MVRNFTIVIEGGIVQAVVTDDPGMVGVGFDIIDYDTQGASREEIRYIDQGDASNSKAVVTGGYVEKSKIKILDKEEDETHDSS